MPLRQWRLNFGKGQTIAFIIGYDMCRIKNKVIGKGTNCGHDMLSNSPKRLNPKTDRPGRLKGFIIAKYLTKSSPQIAMRRLSIMENQSLPLLRRILPGSLGSESLLFVLLDPEGVEIRDPLRQVP